MIIPSDFYRTSEGYDVFRISAIEMIRYRDQTWFVYLNNEKVISISDSDYRRLIEILDVK